jgi:tetratricopeptide (TPR) repeat protein
MKSLNGYILLALILLGPVFSSFSGPLEDGIALHNKAYRDRGYIREAKQELGKLADVYPLAKAYYGSTVAMEAETMLKKNPFKALALLNDGIKIMDDAVREDPENKNIRLLRLLNSSVVDEKSPLNRHRVIGEDVAWFNSVRPVMSDNSQALIWFYEGKYWLKERNRGNALAAFNRCIDLSPNQDIIDLATECLEKM